MTTFRIRDQKLETDDVLEFWLIVEEGTLRLMAQVPGCGAWTVLRIGDEGLKLIGCISADSFPLPLEGSKIKLVK